MNAIIIVPTIRESCIKQFLNEWRDIFKDHSIYVIIDNNYAT